MAYQILRFPYDGTIDADGHVLEPANDDGISSPSGIDACIG